jgi:mono/diheme cytochrome c family protein
MNSIIPSFHYSNLIKPFQITLLLFVGCQANPPAEITDPGQLLFLGYAKKEVNCSRCHGPDGQGGLDAPDIRAVFKKYDEEKIMNIIEFGKGEGKKAMPPFEGKITEEELTTLLKFLKTLQMPDSLKN